MATAAEGSPKSVPITPEEAAQIQHIIAEALASADIGSYELTVVAPVKEEPTNYATLYIHKLAESEE